MVAAMARTTELTTAANIKTTTSMGASKAIIRIEAETGMVIKTTAMVSHAGGIDRTGAAVIAVIAVAAVVREAMTPIAVDADRRTGLALWLRI
jgi:hypothetical protein